jgi:golgi SNAP receptor complex member 1
MVTTIPSPDFRWKPDQRVVPVLRKVFITYAIVVQAKDRAELLAGAREVTPLLGVSVQSNASSLIRERNNIQASTSAIDGVLAQAGALGSNLHEQRGLFDNIGHKLMTVGSKFPVINGLMNAVRRRKSWDTIVVTAVVVVCSLLLFMYLLRKWF